MKKAISLLLFSFIVINLYSQDINESITDKDYFQQKSRKQFKTGWILLGVGTSATIVGGIGFDKNFVLFEEGGNDTKANIYGFLMLAGVAMNIASIPVFISAFRNKKRATTLVFDNQTFYGPMSDMMSYQTHYTPSLTLRITF